MIDSGNSYIRLLREDFFTLEEIWKTEDNITLMEPPGGYGFKNNWAHKFNGSCLEI
jgi:hypothetical protein